MVRRFAAASALVLAALALSPAARAQGFFSFYEMSPRDVLSRLDDQGYSPRVPMTRRGEVYIVDASTASGRPVRLIVSARDGRILQRYGAAPRFEDYGRSRWRDEDPNFRRGDDEDYDHRPQAALGDPSRPRVLNFDDSDRMVPPATVPDVPERPKHRAAKKPVAPPVAKDTPTPEPSEAAVAPSDAKAGSAHIVDLPPAKPVAAPVKSAPSPEPTNQAKVETPKPSAPRIVGEPLNQPKSEDKPAPKAEAPKAEAPKAAPAQAKAEEKPKAEAPRKKLNDLPVGTLD